MLIRNSASAGRKLNYYTIITFLYVTSSICICPPLDANISNLIVEFQTGNFILTTAQITVSRADNNTAYKCYLLHLMCYDGFCLTRPVEYNATLVENQQIQHIWRNLPRGITYTPRVYLTWRGQNTTLIISYLTGNAFYLNTSKIQGIDTSHNETTVLLTHSVPLFNTYSQFRYVCYYIHPKAEGERRTYNLNLTVDSIEINNHAWSKNNSLTNETLSPTEEHPLAAEFTLMKIWSLDLQKVTHIAYIVIYCGPADGHDFNMSCGETVNNIYVESATETPVGAACRSNSTGWRNVIYTLYKADVSLRLDFNQTVVARFITLCFGEYPHPRIKVELFRPAHLNVTTQVISRKTHSFPSGAQYRCNLSTPADGSQWTHHTTFLNNIAPLPPKKLIVKQTLSKVIVTWKMPEGNFYHTVYVNCSAYPNLIQSSASETEWNDLEPGSYTFSAWSSVNLATEDGIQTLYSDHIYTAVLDVQDTFGALELILILLSSLLAVCVMTLLKVYVKKQRRKQKAKARAAQNNAVRLPMRELPIPKVTVNSSSYIRTEDSYNIINYNDNTFYSYAPWNLQCTSNAENEQTYYTNAQNDYADHPSADNDDVYHEYQHSSNLVKGDYSHSEAVNIDHIYSALRANDKVE